jgi:hypothetical protein
MGGGRFNYVPFRVALAIGSHGGSAHEADVPTLSQISKAVSFYLLRCRSEANYVASRVLFHPAWVWLHISDAMVLQQPAFGAIRNKNKRS